MVSLKIKEIYMALKTIFVTGGGGFLGKHICMQLKDSGYEVVSFSRNHYPELQALGIESRTGDIASLTDLEQALPQNCYGIIHTAGKVGIWGRAQGYFNTNVIGTQNLLTLAKKIHCPRFVFTSSPSVVFGGQDICGADETLAYPTTYNAQYPYTKMLAEKAVLAANSPELATAALRPHLIWGVGDPHFLPRLRQKAMKGKIAKIGGQKNLVDVIHVENAARAHIQLLEKLPNSCGGEVYFIGQERPVLLWEFMDQLLASQNLGPIKKSLPYALAYGLASMSELAYKSFSIFDREPALSRFLVQQLSHSHYFCHQKAKNHFDYHPQISIEDGLRLMGT